MASSESEDEVLGVNVTSDEEEEDDRLSELAASDVEGQGEDDDDIPNVHAWGKDKRKYYQTDYVDQDYGGHQGKDAFLADQEEEEAANLQKELTQKLNEAAFSLDFIDTKTDEEVVDASQVSELKRDINKLSKRQKIELLKKESPEFFGLIEEYKSKQLLLKEFLEPIIKLENNGKVPNCNALSFVHTLRDLIISYTNCITFYFLLKTSKASVTNHPVIKRMNQFRELIVQMEPTFEEVIKPQIEIILMTEKEASVKEKTHKKTLNVLKKLTESQKIDQKPTKNKEKKVEFNMQEEGEEEDSGNASSSGDEDNDNKMDVDNEEDEAEGEDENARRPITYQIAKNKGLTPHRKKEQRNPRVKYKNRFRKATIRRKGAVRSVRTEMSRYGGEVSGIKATVSKSIKLKT